MKKDKVVSLRHKTLNQKTVIKLNSYDYNVLHIHYVRTNKEPTLHMANEPWPHWKEFIPPLLSEWSEQFLAFYYQRQDKFSLIFIEKISYGYKFYNHTYYVLIVLPVLFVLSMMKSSTKYLCEWYIY